jgi:hypothetical protein
VTRAKRSIAQFRLRTGMPSGAKVSLRGQRMYDFLERTMRLALPRIRDFRGIATRSFDGRGNFSLGLREQLVYPEIDYDKIDRLRGLEISIVTTAKTDEEGRRLLQLLGMPFQASSETTWQRSRVSPGRRARRATRSSSTTAARSVAGRVGTCAASRCAGSASVSGPWRASYRE